MPKHLAQWRSTSPRHLIPVHGEKRCEQCDRSVLAILTPIWTTKTETGDEGPAADRTRSGLGAAMGQPDRPGTRLLER